MLLCLQLLDRFEKMREGCPYRKKMLGVVWGRQAIELWRFDGGDQLWDFTCVRSGVSSFDWEDANDGYQVCGNFLRVNLMPASCMHDMYIIVCMIACQGGISIHP